LAEQIKAEEVLARACANMPTSNLQALVNGLQAYHEQWYKEFVQASTDVLPRMQGKIQAIEQIVKVVLESRQTVAKIDARRVANTPADGQRMAM